MYKKKRGDHMTKFRNPNFFETIVLIVGLVMIIFGYTFIYQQILITGLTWNAIQAIFLWLMLLGLLIVMSVNENVKEELKEVVELQLEETRLLRKTINQQKKNGK